MPSAEPLVLELDPAGGPALRIEWDLDALRELGAAGRQPGDRRGPAGVAPGAGAGLGAGERSAADLGDLRRRRAARRGGDSAARGRGPRRRRSWGDPRVARRARSPALTRPFCPPSTGRTARARRLGLEIYQDPAGPPVRIAADRIADAREGAGGGQAALTLRMEGTPGTGLHQLIEAL